MEITIKWVQNGYIITHQNSGDVYVCPRDEGEIIKASKLPEILEIIGNRHYNKSND